jgi:hypothetical protein
MKLSDWLAKNNMNPAEFGRALGLKYPRNVYRYVHLCGEMKATPLLNDRFSCGMGTQWHI